MQEVQRGLVHQALRLGRGVPGGRAQVAQGGFLQRGIGQVIDAFGPVAADAGGGRQVAGDQRQVGQFAAAMAGRVGGQDLLGQGGAAARHAHHQQRSPIRVARPAGAACAQARPVQAGDDAIDRTREPGRIAGTGHAAAGGIGLLPAIHRRFVITAPVQHLAQFVADQGPVRVGQGRVGHQRPRLLDQRFAGPGAVQAKQAADREGPARLRVQRGLVGPPGGVTVAGVFGGLGQGHPQVAVRLARSRPLQQVQGLLVAAQAVEGLGGAQQGMDVVRLRLQQRLPQRQRVLRVAGMELRLGQDQGQAGMLRCQRADPAQRGQGFALATGALQRHAHQVPGLGVVGLGGQAGLEMPDRLARLALVGEQAGELEVQGRIGRGQVQCAPHGGLGQTGLAQAHRRLGNGQVRLRVAAGAEAGTAQRLQGFAAPALAFELGSLLQQGIGGRSEGRHRRGRGGRVAIIARTRARADAGVHGGRKIRRDPSATGMPPAQQRGGIRGPARSARRAWCPRRPCRCPARTGSCRG